VQVELVRQPVQDVVKRHLGPVLLDIYIYRYYIYKRDNVVQRHLGPVLHRDILRLYYVCGCIPSRDAPVCACVYIPSKLYYLTSLHSAKVFGCWRGEMEGAIIYTWRQRHIYILYITYIYTYIYIYIYIYI
jgi:hypothetical protein